MLLKLLTESYFLGLIFLLELVESNSKVCVELVKQSIFYIASKLKLLLELAQLSIILLYA